MRNLYHFGSSLLYNNGKSISVVVLFSISLKILPYKIGCQV